MGVSDDRGPGGDQRISVSRDALRAELAEMELRLRTWIDTKFHEKADAIIVNALVAQMTELSQGRFNEPQKNSIGKLIEEQIDSRSDSSWTSRERRFAVVGVFVSVLTLIITTALTLHYAGGVG